MIGMSAWPDGTNVLDDRRASGHLEGAEHNEDPEHIGHQEMQHLDLDRCQQNDVDDPDDKLEEDDGGHAVDASPGATFGVICGVTDEPDQGETADDPTGIIVSLTVALVLSAMN